MFTMYFSANFACPDERNLCSVYAMCQFNRSMNKHFCLCKNGFTGDGNICTGRCTLRKTNMQQ